jgi:hypothetical protein
MEVLDAIAKIFSLKTKQEILSEGSLDEVKTLGDIEIEPLDDICIVMIFIDY